MSNFFTDRESGARLRTVMEIDERVWGGFFALIQSRIDDGSFGYRFPEKCQDGYGLFGCDQSNLRLVLAAQVPSVAWPLLPTQLQSTPETIDLLEFCAQSLGRPNEVSYHSFFRHHHLNWDREVGLVQFVSEVNQIFGRNGLAYEMNEVGQVYRVLPQNLAEQLSRTLFKTGDSETDRLLELARQMVSSPKPQTRQDGLEKLWDAFERIKTLELGTDKRIQTTALLDKVARAGTKFREEIEKEAKALTNIGNAFRIRHSETSQEILDSSEQMDYFFSRMFAFIRLILVATNRGG